MQRIAESELILNARGAIYHLDLLPGELADCIITVGDPFRVKQVSKHFDSIELQRHHREFVTHTGYVGKKRISVISTGIGTDNIDIVLNELDAVANIDLATRMVKTQTKSMHIIRIGTAGALQTDVPVDSFVASTHGIGIDNLLNYYRVQNNEEEKQLIQAFITQTGLNAQSCSPSITSANASLLKYFIPGFHHGITVTCPGFYGPQGRVLRLGIKNPALIDNFTRFNFGQHRIVNFEMETSGIYGLGSLLGHQCISLSAVVANRVNQQFSNDSLAAVERLIIKTLDIISTI